MSRRSPKVWRQWLRLAAYAGLSLLLFASDRHPPGDTGVRAALTWLLTPVRLVATVPGQWWEAAGSLMTSTASLRAENAALTAANAHLHNQLLRYDALKASDARLRALTGAAPRVAVRSQVVRVIGIGSAPFSRKLLLAVGASAGIYLGQPVIDANGIVGQISRVGPEVSEVILITDPNHEIPVEDLATGQRAFVAGTGAANRVDVPYLTPSASIHPGDLLVSSGIGGVFPPGYPVARVLSVAHDPNEAFLAISARPAAGLNEGHHVLVIWPTPGLRLPRVTIPGKPAPPSPAPTVHPTVLPP